MFEQITVDRQVFGNGEDLLVCGDSSAQLGAMDALKGKIQCVYLDPPFRTGSKFERRRPFGAKGWKTGSPAPGYRAYNDAMSEKSWLRMMRGMTRQAYELLSDTGVFCLHLDWRMNAQARILCDKIFGADKFLNEIIWSYESGGRSKRTFSRKHDVILLYAKGKNYKFDLTKVPLERTENRNNHMRREMDEDGRIYSVIRSAGKEYRYYDDEPVYPGDVWTDISHLQQKDPERTGYATQKPMKLLERLLLPVTEPGDWVADLCLGSGTLAATAEKMGLRYAAADLNPEALAVTLGRLKNPNVTVACATDKHAARLDGEWENGRLTLKDLESAHPAFPEKCAPGDRLEQWEIGTVKDGTFYTEQHFGRNHRYPGLTMEIALDDPTGKAVMTTDAAGIRRAYLVKI